MRKLAAALAAAGLITVTAASHTEATVMNWRVPTRYVYYYDYTGSSYARAGINDWSRSNTGANLYVGRTFDKTKAKITIRWQDLPAPNLAWAEYSTQNGYLLSCHIKLDVQIKKWSWDRIRKTANHEAGHCMGLAHTTYAGSVMSTAWPRYMGYRPTWYDKRDMVNKYGRL